MRFGSLDSRKRGTRWAADTCRLGWLTGVPAVGGVRETVGVGAGIERKVHALLGVLPGRGRLGWLMVINCQFSPF